MEFKPTPSFTDIFQTNIPPLGELLKDIPSQVVLGVLSMISSELQADHYSKETQIRIFQFITKRFTKQQQDLIWDGIYPFIKNSTNPIIFAKWYITEFMMSELINFRDLPLPDDTTPDQEFRIFQAYLIHIEILNERQSKILVETRKEQKFHFQRITWPMVMVQYDFGTKVDPYYHGFRALILISELLKKESTSQFVNNFLKVTEQSNYFKYVVDFIKIVELQKSENQNKLQPFILTETEDYKAIYSALTLNVSDIRVNANTHSDYLAIRDKPLFKITEKSYYVLNWNYLANKIYTGFLFDFYKRSGISTIYKSFDLFKSVETAAVSEKILFQRLIKSGFSNHRIVIKFDDTNLDGYPDCYVRNGKHIFLFEFKDTWIPSHVIHSSSYEVLEKDLRDKFIMNTRGRAKGISQLLNHIQTLNSGGFEFDRFANLNLKVRNLVVYPIIVYTHSMFSMPGINSYLNEIMQEELKAQQISDSGITIKELVMIDLEFFFNYFAQIGNGKVDFREILEKYIIRIKNNQQKFKKQPTPESAAKAHSSFEHEYRSLLTEHQRDFRKVQVDELFRIFPLTEPQKY